MTFPFNVYVMAVASSWLVTVAAVPLWRRWCLRTGLVDDPGERKIHDTPIPLAGGLAVMTGLAVPLLLGWLALWLHGPSGSFNLALLPLSRGDSPPTDPGQLLNPHAASLLRHGFGRRGVELLGILAGALGILWVGWLDDKIELRPRAKFAGQTAVALLVAASGARITLFVPSLAFHYAVTVLWILTLINAFNFMDNMNGLCTGLGAISAVYFGILGAAAGHYLVALIAWLTTGALLGFLPYNFPRARAFLGDAGSHLVGYLLSVLAILPHFYTQRDPRKWKVLIPLFVLAVPLLDLVWVVLLRWRNGKPFYQGDTNHLSHRLVRSGLTRVQAVLLIWFLAVLAGLVCFL